MQQNNFTVPSDPLQRAWIALARVAPKMQEAVEASLKEAGLPPLEWYSVLWSLERAGGEVRPRDLGEALFLARYNVSRLIDRMEAEGLVARRACPGDARGHNLALTPKGKELRLKMWAVHAPAMARAMAPLNDAEALALQKLLEKLG
ncbi:MAG: MarR family winged helix-turn-helix transcriptional regulator [Hyphomonadaceae bacterium]